LTSLKRKKSLFPKKKSVRKITTMKMISQKRKKKTNQMSMKKSQPKNLPKKQLPKRLHKNLLPRRHPSPQPKPNNQQPKPQDLSQSLLLKRVLLQKADQATSKTRTKRKSTSCQGTFK
jgi:hypothetical protein